LSDSRSRSPIRRANAGVAQVTFHIERYEEIVRLTVTHENLADEREYADVAGGWSAVLSNLKTMLETGHALPRRRGAWTTRAVAEPKLSYPARRMDA
jgi:hypothetical protein